MFILTLNRVAVKRIAVATGCMAVLIGGIITVNSIAKRDVDILTGAQVEPISITTKVKNTQDMVTYLLNFDVEVDVSTAKVQTVTIPKKFDADFEAFNDVIKETGGDLSKYKNKDVDKWTILCPALSVENGDGNAILLVYKEKVIGGYIMLEPQGDVQPLNMLMEKSTETLTIDEEIAQIAAELETQDIAETMTIPEEDFPTE